MAWIKNAAMSLFGLFWDLGYTEANYLEEVPSNLWTEEEPL